MGAKKLAAKEDGADRAVTVDLRKPATAADLMESMVATEAELKALWEEMDSMAGIGCRTPTRR